MTTRTEVSRANGYTAVWFNGRVLSAWLDETGESANLHGAHALTRDPAYPAPPVPPNPEDLGSTQRRWADFKEKYLTTQADCKHGLPRRLCMVCGADPANLGGVPDA